MSDIFANPVYIQLGNEFYELTRDALGYVSSKKVSRRPVDEEVQKAIYEMAFNDEVNEDEDGTPCLSYFLKDENGNVFYFCG